MKLIYLHIYKDTYSIFMQVYRPWDINNINQLISKNRKINILKNLKKFLIVKLEFK